MNNFKRFQSTHSIRSATFTTTVEDMSPKKISIHALHTECDNKLLPTITRKFGFQSTHSIRSATSQYADLFDINDISIHALHTECDSETTRNNVIKSKNYHAFSIIIPNYRNICDKKHPSTNTCVAKRSRKRCFRQNSRCESPREIM